MHSTVFSMRHVVVIAALALSGSAFAAGQDGQTVFKDSQTGELRNPTAIEAKQLNDLRAAQRAAAVAARKISGAPPANVATIQANGIQQAFLDEDSVSYSVMTRNANGELMQHCVTGADAAIQTMFTATTATSKGSNAASKEHQHETQ
jgi:hypothetical protein